MTARDNPVTVYLTDEEKAQIAEWADKAGKSQSDLLRDAVLEFTDRDRAARIEDKLDRVLTQLDGDTHAHTPAATGSASVPERAREIARLVYQNHDLPVKGADVEIAIENVAGGDERTVSKYKEQLKKRGLLYRHPMQPVWTDEKREWVQWVENATVSDDVHDHTQEYDMDTDEYDRLAEEVTA